MFGQLYERALGGQRCWLRYDDGATAVLPIGRWLGGHGTDEIFDDAVVRRCAGPTIELGCGPGRLVARLLRRGIPALGVDQSPTAVRLAWRRGAAVMLGDVFGPLPGAGTWHTVLLADGSIGLGADPRRLLARASHLLRPGGQCVVEFDAATTGVRAHRMRLESNDESGPWFSWAAVGADSGAALAAHAGLALTAHHRIGARVLATLAAPA